MLSIYDISVYPNSVVPTIVPEIVSASDRSRSPSMAAASREREKGATVFLSTMHPGKQRNRKRLLA